MTDLSPDARRLVDEWRGAAAPTTAERDAIRSAIAGRLAAPSTGSGGKAVASAKSAAAGLGAAKVVAIAALFAAVAIGAVWTWRSRASEDTARQVPQHKVGTVSPRLEPQGPPRSAHALAAPTELPTQKPEAIAEVRKHTPRIDRRAPSRTLAEETALIAAARGALQVGDAAGGLVLLDKYAQGEGDRQLEREATLLRIQALCDLGHEQQARHLGEAARTRWPHSQVDEALTSCANK